MPRHGKKNGPKSGAWISFLDNPIGKRSGNPSLDMAKGPKSIPFLVGSFSIMITNQFSSMFISKFNDVIIFPNLQMYNIFIESPSDSFSAKIYI